MEFLFILGRIILGGYFIKNGYHHLKHSKMLAGYAASKGVPMAQASVLVTGLMLLLGGLGILLGVYINVSVALLVIFLIGTLIKMHTFWKVTEPMAKMSESIQFQKNLALMGALLLILSIPQPWMYVWWF